MGQQVSGARRVAEAAAYASGGLVAAGALAAGVLFGQAFVARMTIPGAEAPPPRCAGDYGDQYAGAASLTVALLGDSTAAGYGVSTRSQTPGALLATWIADAAQRPVRLVCPAVVGAFSAGLPPQVADALDERPDLAIILIGANDVTGRIRIEDAVRHLYEAVCALRAAGAEVVVATCPDLGTIKPIQPPLRWLARHWSRQLAAAQTIAVVRAGGRTVSLSDLLGPEFAAAPDRMFGADGFHPSPDGYAIAAATILPTALVALGLAEDGPGTARGEGIRSLAAAAAKAANRAGTEVSRADVAGSDRTSGRWAKLRRRLNLVPKTRANRPGAGQSMAGAAARDRASAVPSVAGQHDVVRPAAAPPAPKERS